jgi:hypothetical protein
VIRDHYLDHAPAGEIPPPRWGRALGLGLAATGVLCTGFLLGHQSVPDAPARIGGTDVAVGTRCQEDEAIALVGPGSPVCVNVAELAGPHGNRVTVRGVSYDMDDQSRPACFMEPSETPEGVEVILYAHLSDKTSDRGIEVTC